MNSGVKIENLRVKTKGIVLLDDINLQFEMGRIHVLVGPSGSGKTTLLRCVNRLNDLFDGLEIQGQVHIPWPESSRPIYDTGLTGTQVRRRVGMVFQSPNVLPVSIRRNFHIPLKTVLGLTAEECNDAMHRALLEAGLWDEVGFRLDENATRLSGGQQQRLCLARALALDPKVLLLDEPTANLDFRATAKVEKLLISLKKSRLFLVVSHNLDQAARLADRVVALDKGRVVLDQNVNSNEGRRGLEQELQDCFQMLRPHSSP